MLKKSLKTNRANRKEFKVSILSFRVRAVLTMTLSFTRSF